MPKLSIITINLNNAEGLRKTIKSVVSQTFIDYEYIVIDGASTDDSVEVIKEFATNITFWVSEPDSGIYNAMNKGISNSIGEYCLFLNSGDIFSGEQSLNSFSVYLNENFDILYGDIKVVNGGVELIKTYPANLSFKYFIYDTLPHPASLIKRSLFLNIENYDENLKICSDWIFFIKAICLHNCSYLHIEKVISTFYLDGISSNSENQKLITIEKLDALKKYFSAFYDDYKRLECLETFRQKVLDSMIIRIIKRIGLLNRIKYD
jgi:Glycosyltransferases involved in cell wall biogenesis